MPGMRPTVLLVDDHAGFRFQARALLEDEGYEVVGEAADGVAGLAAARDLRPDIVMLDIQLPGVDGIEVARQLRAQAPETSIVLISTRDRGDYGDRLDSAAADGFIAKADLDGQRLRDLLGRP
jgi:DNA-binding NarL/FixJ family response regulator